MKQQPARGVQGRGGGPLSAATGQQGELLCLHTQEHTLVPTGEQQGESSHDLLVHRGLSAEKKPLMVYGGI